MLRKEDDYSAGTAAAYREPVAGCVPVSDPRARETAVRLLSDYDRYRK